MEDPVRIQLTCAHYRLLEREATIMGVGAHTWCEVCDASRMVVRIEEVGALYLPKPGIASARRPGVG
jgi:hypothetical protein